jgi:hypothetical protein
MGRPPIGKRPMTSAERQRRHRQQTSHVTQKPAAASQPSAFRDTGAVTKLVPLVSAAELQQWADELEIDAQSMDRLLALMTRRMLDILVEDPEAAARWIVCAHGYLNCLDFQEALNDAIDAADEADE